MLLDYIRYVTPTMRVRSEIVRQVNLLNFNLKKFVWLKRRKSGRNNRGVITSRGRRATPQFLAVKTNFLDLSNKDFFFKELITNKFTQKWFVTVFTSDGFYFALPAVNFAEVGEVEYGVEGHTVPYTTLNIGTPILLKFIPYFFKLSNLWDRTNLFPKYSTSPGTFSIKLKAQKKEKLLKIKLPSDQIKFFTHTTLALVGSNLDENKKGFKPGKAGFNSVWGKRPISRGVARNPVDHPNGGRTKSCQPEKSPWGWVAKYNK